MHDGFSGLKCRCYDLLVERVIRKGVRVGSLPEIPLLWKRGHLICAISLVASLKSECILCPAHRFLWATIHAATKEIESEIWGMHRQPIHSINVHTHASVSLFSKNSNFTNFDGLYNLCILLLCVNLLRLIIENFLRYGFLIRGFGSVRDWSLQSFFHSLVFFAFSCALGFGCTHANALGACRVPLFLAILLALLSFIPTLIFSKALYPFPGAFLLVITLILAMKLTSYFLTINELRHFDASPKISPLKFVRFLFLPTLCYQPSYPQSTTMSGRFLFKNFLELIVSLSMMKILIEQYALPAAEHAMEHLASSKVLAIIERILELSVPCLCVWLLGFYAVFHALFNLTAELLYFGDRTFYLDWWNARDLADYWRLWNIPVYLWLKRHVHKPLRAKGFSPIFSQFIIFLISALFHEYLIAIPTRTTTALASIVMTLQVPLICLTKYVSHRYPASWFGNCFFWVTFCILGLPLCVLFYYWSWATRS